MKKVTKEITMLWRGGGPIAFEIKIRAGRAVTNKTSHGEKLPDGEYFLEDIPTTEKPPYTSFPHLTKVRTGQRRYIRGVRII